MKLRAGCAQEGADYKGRGNSIKVLPFTVFARLWDRIQHGFDDRYFRN
jgi:hypothetical protein